MLPNPSSSETKVIVNVPVDDKVSIIVYDIQGRKIFETLKPYTEAGIHEIDISTRHFDAGIYNVAVCVGTNMIIKKLSVVK